MQRFLLYCFFCSLFLISLVGVCIAVETSSSVIYIQGGESSVTNGSDGMLISVKDVIPFIDISTGDENHLYLVKELANMSYPVKAAVVFKGSDTESTSMITVTNVSLSDKNKILTLQVNPLEFYEGEVLKSFASNQMTLSGNKSGKNNTISIYLEPSSVVPSNGGDCNPCLCCDFGGSGECGYICRCGAGCT